MGLRRRNEFDAFGSQDMPREDLNLTNYDEKFIMPTDRAARFVSSPVPEVQSPVQTPAPDPTEQSYVFRQSDMFGAQQNDQRSRVFRQAPEAPAPVQPQMQPQMQSQMQPQSSAFAPSAERPMVFAMRDDKDMYVYEFSDRLEFYRRTTVGMVHCATKFRAGKR